MLSVFAAVGLYALLQGASRGDLVGIGLGLFLFTLGTYYLIKVLRGPYLPRAGTPDSSAVDASIIPDESRSPCRARRRNRSAPPAADTAAPLAHAGARGNNCVLHLVARA